jgi:hypothetical protein
VVGVKMKKYVLSYLLLISTTSYAGMSCESLFEKKSSTILEKRPISAEVQANLSELISEVYKLDLEKSYKQLIKIDWDKYVALNKLNDYIKLEKISQQTVETYSLLAYFGVESKIISNEINELLKNEDYKLQYQKHLDRNYSFYKMLENINQQLGINVFPKARFDLVPTNEQTISEAEALVKRLNEDYEKDFKLTGYKNLEEYRNYAMNHSKTAQLAVDILQDHTIVALHRHEKARPWLVSSGFQNQRVTGSSSGTLSENFRNDYESACTDIPLLEYKDKSVRFMPNYAEAIASFDTEYKNGDGADKYGSDLWIIKKDVVSKRATLTPGDSMARGREQMESKNALNNFIPWSQRILTAGSLLSKLVYNQYRYDNQANDFKVNLQRWSKIGWGYFEVQIFGALTLDHVEAFYFKRNPPDVEFANLLRSKNIKIYDARGYDAYHKKPTEWLD